MLNAATARALADVAARANDVLHAYDPSYEPNFPEARAARRVVRADDALAVAPPDDSSFVVGGPAGERRYSRDGRLKFSEGRLHNADGDVLGFAPGAARNAVPQPLRADAIDVALGRTIDLRVEPDGTVAYNRTVTDPRTMQRATQRVVVGTIALARFPAGSNPARAQTAPHLGRPAEAGFGALATRARALGPVDINLGLAKLQEAYLALDALQGAQKARSDLDAGAMNLVK